MVYHYAMHGVMGLWYKLRYIGFMAPIVVLAGGHRRVDAFE